MRSLAGAARRVAGGDLDARAPLTGSSEQREVASAFNEMTGRLSDALRTQREFVANASHQLRTPLTGLRLRLEAAGLKSGDPAVARELDAAEREVERLSSLLAQLLTLAREGERPAGERVALRDAASAALERWAGPAAGSGHDLRLGTDGDVAVEATRDDVAVILDNLVENSLNYAPGGTVTIEWSEADGCARLAVIDEGPGLDPSEAERVFERFFRGSASRDGAKGTGLGLAVVGALARRWGGEATMANRPEGGARAEVRLPALGAGQGLPSPHRELPDPLPGRG